MDKTIVIVGVKHCGKTTQGELLAKHYRCPFYDTDSVITDMTGRTPRELYAESGQEAFMRAEAQACRFLAQELSDAERQAVVATGGGVCDNNEAVRVLKTLGPFLLLFAEEEAAYRRIVYDARMTEEGTIANLPAYLACHNPRSFDEVQSLFHEFYEERMKKYTAIADTVFFAEPVSIEENSRRLIALCDTL
ncbi:MAG TPA: hypothetical protein IAA30_04790 [Candidatus Treponema faecavium]|nr:hypothetical protein [Candidatus Treponema faecavium]